MKKIAQDTFLQIEWLNSKLFFIDIASSKEINSLLSLYKQFNFSHQSLYTIGYSISGTTFKAASFYSDIRGITFQTLNIENSINFLQNSSLQSNPNPVGQIINVYSKNSFLIENDNKCDINAIIPQLDLFPNVYDTACMTAISCSKFKKYVPFCSQILNLKSKMQINEFKGGG